MKKRIRSVLAFFVIIFSFNILLRFTIGHHLYLRAIVNTYPEKKHFSEIIPCAVISTSSELDAATKSIIERKLRIDYRHLIWNQSAKTPNSERAHFLSFIVKSKTLFTFDGCWSYYNDSGRIHDVYSERTKFVWVLYRWVPISTRIAMS